jgi:glycolate oxidase FAD binding subunit
VNAALAPRSAAELAAIVVESAKAARPLEIRGGGTKAGMGRPTQTAATLDMRGLAGVTLYEPAEMVIAARAGTPLREVEEALAEKGQMLPFEPPYAVPGGAGEPTVGGIVAANLSGPRRIAAGACRDALIGVRFVNGRGEEIVSGGRVMKNVTGYDLLKVQAGAWGTLGVLTEATFRVLPRPASQTTLVWEGLDDARALRLLCAAMGTPFEVSGAAHLPDGRTCLRLENVPASLDYRAGRLAEALKAYGAPRRLDAPASAALWTEIGEARALPLDDRTIWRVSTAPNRAAALVAGLRERLALAALYDWSGGLVRLAVAGAADGGEAVIRAATKAQGGHATLVAAPEALRASLAPFEPQHAPLMRLTRELKRAFDPAGVFNPGRMYARV